MPTPEEAERMRELLQYEGQPLPDNKPELAELNASIKALTKAKELAALVSSNLIACGHCAGPAKVLGDEMSGYQIACEDCGLAAPRRSEPREAYANWVKLQQAIAQDKPPRDGTGGANRKDSRNEENLEAQNGQAVGSSELFGE